VPLAALLQEKTRYAGKRVGLILSGGNIDMPIRRRSCAAQRLPPDLGNMISEAVVVEK
jgi:threonine dehydratase